MGGLCVHLLNRFFRVFGHAVGWLGLGGLAWVGNQKNGEWFLSVDFNSGFMAGFIGLHRRETRP